MYYISISGTMESFNKITDARKFAMVYIKTHKNVKDITIVSSMNSGYFSDGEVGTVLYDQGKFYYSYPVAKRGMKNTVWKTKPLFKDGSILKNKKV